MTTSSKRFWFPALCLLLLLPLAQACNGVGGYYDMLTGIPQAATERYSYRPNYAVGDTIDIYGYFGALDSDLHVTIGGVEGQLAVRRAADKNLQLIRVPVTAAMGLGAGRLVTFTLNGQTTQGPPIYIRAAGGTQAFRDTLVMAPTGFNFSPSTKYFIQAWSGTGRVFYFDFTTKTINAWKDSVATTLFSDFRDARGAFTITNLTAAGLDRKERYLYFSAATQDSGSTATVWRFVKIDLTTKQLTTLNRTPGSFAAGPWEGPVGQVQLPLMYLVSVAQNGDVYVSPSRSHSRASMTIVAKIDAAGTVSYLVGSLPRTTVAKPTMVFSNPGGGSGYFKAVIDADSHLFYRLDAVQPYSSQAHYIINVWDLEQGREVYSFVPRGAALGVPIVLDGPFEAVQYDQGGVWFLQNGRVVFFLSASNTWNNIPAAVRIDFQRRETETYAPVVIGNTGGSFLGSTILNYTPEGHIVLMRSFDWPEPGVPLWTLELSRIKPRAQR